MTLMMRTTVRLDEHLISQAKQVAAKTGQTLTAVIEEALRVKFAANRKRSASAKITLPACGAGGLLPGVDLDDGALLSELMDRRSSKSDLRLAVWLHPLKGDTFVQVRNMQNLALGSALSPDLIGRGSARSGHLPVNHQCESAEYR
jgi:predicted transcriptional regulator